MVNRWYMDRATFVSRHNYARRGRFKRRSLGCTWKVRDIRPRSTIYGTSQSCLHTRLSARMLHIPAVEVSYHLFLLPLWPQILLHYSLAYAAIRVRRIMPNDRWFNTRLIILLFNSVGSISTFCASCYHSYAYLLRVLIFRLFSCIINDHLVCRKTYW